MFEVKSKIKTICNDLTGFSKLRKGLFVFISVFFGVAFFSITALSGRAFFNYVNIAIYAFLSVCCIIYVFLFGQFKIGWFGLFLFLFNFFTFCSWIVNGCSNLSLTVLLVTGCSFLFYQFLSQNETHLRWPLFAIGLGAICFILYFIIVYRSDFFSPKISATNRIGTYFGNQNDTARFLCFSVLVLFYFAFSKKIYLYYLFSFAGFYCIALTGSISNLLSGFLTIVFFMFYSFSKKGKIVLSITLVVLASILIFALSFPAMSYYRTRLIGIFSSLFGTTSISGEDDLSALYRLVLAEEGFYMFLERPLFGYGFDGVLKNSFAGTFSHNNISDVAGNFGIFAVLIFQVLILFPLLIKNKNKNKKTFSFIFCVYIFIFQLFLVSYYSKTEYFLLSFCYSDIVPKDVESLSSAKQRNSTQLYSIDL